YRTKRLRRPLTYVAIALLLILMSLLAGTVTRYLRSINAHSLTVQANEAMELLPAFSLDLAMQALKIDRSDEAILALRRALLASKEQARTRVTSACGGNEYQAAHFLPSGEGMMVVTESCARVWNTSSRRWRGPTVHFDGRVVASALSRESRLF